MGSFTVLIPTPDGEETLDLATLDVAVREVIGGGPPPRTATRPPPSSPTPTPM